MPPCCSKSSCSTSADAHLPHVARLPALPRSDQLPSSGRSRHICPHFAHRPLPGSDSACGGCQLQHLDYREQLSHKHQQFGALITAALGRAAPPIPDIIGDPDPWPAGFRQKAAFAFTHAAPGRRLVLGHLARGSRTVVPVSECLVHAPRANQLAFALADTLARAGIAAAGPRLDGLVRYVVVRATADERESAVLLTVTRNDRALRAPVRKFLHGTNPPTSFALTVHAGDDPFLVGSQTVRLAGPERICERALEVPFLLSPAAFFQTNVRAAAVLLKQVANAIVEAPADALASRPLRVLDLYAGVGLFTVPLAVRGCRVTAVEENVSAVADAQATLRLNKLNGGAVSIVGQRVETALPRLAPREFDAVVLDPPRQGCSAETLRTIFSALMPARVVYVSCNPRALASELPGIVATGYAVRRVQPIDMFPHTDHLESVVVLDRQRASR